MPLLAALLVFVLIIWLGFYIVQRRDAAAKRRTLALVTSYASAQDVHEAIAAASTKKRCRDWNRRAS